jgi:hypothetical protein
MRKVRKRAAMSSGVHRGLYGYLGSRVFVNFGVRVIALFRRTVTIIIMLEKLHYKESICQHKGEFNVVCKRQGRCS